MNTLKYALGLGRSFARSRMLDRCQIHRITGKQWDETTGEHHLLKTLVYEGFCRVTETRTAPTREDAAGQQIVLDQLELHLPVTAEAARATAGDMATITASATRPDLTGRALRIVAPFDGTQTTALRFRTEAQHAD